VECPKCGIENVAEAVYCTSCGKALNAQEAAKRGQNRFRWKDVSRTELVVIVLGIIALTAVNAFFFYYSPVIYGRNNDLSSLIIRIVLMAIIDLSAFLVLSAWLTTRRVRLQWLWNIVLISAFYTYFFAAMVYKFDFGEFWGGIAVITFVALIVYGIKSVFFD